MMYGEVFTIKLVDRMTGERIPQRAVYKRVTWGEYHTDDLGDGLWCGDRQIAGTCDFTVRGCQTEKAAKAKIRDRVNR